MRVNENKTGLMCVSAARSFDPRVSVSFNGQIVKGKESLKILGVTLDRDCFFNTHVTQVAKKLRGKTWALTRLKRKGMREEDLIQAYKSTIRPSAEYASPVWHSSISAYQSEYIERQQTQALKNIYGVGRSANKMRIKSGLERLWCRREKSCEQFALKNVNNIRCMGWFEKRPQSQYARRAGAAYAVYKEPITRTDRHRNSPINHARRILNRLGWES